MRVAELLKRIDIDDHEALHRLAAACYREGWGTGPDASNGQRLHLGRNSIRDRSDFLRALIKDGSPAAVDAIARLLYAHGFGEPPGRPWTYEMIHGGAQACGCKLCRAAPMGVDSTAGFSIGDVIPLPGGVFRIIDIIPPEKLLVLPYRGFDASQAEATINGQRLDPWVEFPPRSGKGDVNRAWLEDAIVTMESAARPVEWPGIIDAFRDRQLTQAQRHDDLPQATERRGARPSTATRRRARKRRRKGR